MSKIELDLDTAAQTMLKLRQFNDSYDVFTKTGTSVIREVEIEPQQKKKIDEAMQVVEDKTKEIRNTIDEVEELTKTVLEQTYGFSEQEVMKKVDEVASSIKKVEKLSAKKVF